ncbi:hypothetical protein [Salipaludibacillus agaradhaerens]|jgi:uncharacterized protein YxeA|nr:hypothetical protein [Salipaludibacillus agaradhaerens]
MKKKLAVLLTVVVLVGGALSLTAQTEQFDSTHTRQAPIVA